MASLKSFVKLAQQYNRFAIDFVIIYINEAHAADGWRFDGPNYSLVKNHRNVEDRMNAIGVMLDLAEIDEQIPISVYADTMDDFTNHFFRAWPERLYVLHDNKIVYQGEPGPMGYSIPNLEYFLKEHIVHRSSE